MPRRGGGFSGPLTSVAVVGIAMGVTVMVMAVCILRGFRNDITDKVVGFGSHITVRSYAAGAEYDAIPIPAEYAAVRSALERVPGVRCVQAYATKGAMVKTGDQIHGVIFRGLEAGYDTTFFASCLTEGRLPALTDDETDSAGASLPSNEVLVSTTIASKLGLAVGDKMRTYFWQGSTYRARAFTISGLYSSDLAEMDELYVVGDLRQLVRINGWDEGAVGGWEVLVDDFSQLDEVNRRVLSALPYDLTAVTVREANPALFSWLALLSSNITLILVIMSIVCAVAIVSALLIMIFEKSSTIGVLKALGADDRSVRSIFVMRASRLIVEGITIGVALSALLCWVQQRFQLVKLDAESYAMSRVPVDADWRVFVLVSLGTMAVCLLALLLPAAYISKIDPAKTIRTE